jgi:hypothetical protein
MATNSGSNGANTLLAAALEQGGSIKLRVLPGDDPVLQLVVTRFGESSSWSELIRPHGSLARAIDHVASAALVHSFPLDGSPPAGKVHFYPHFSLMQKQRRWAWPPRGNGLESRLSPARFRAWLARLKPRAD